MNNLRLVSIKQLPDEHPGITLSAARMLVHRAKDIGLDAHIYRIGRRIFIDMNGFSRWVIEKNRPVEEIATEKN